MWEQLVTIWNAEIWWSYVLRITTYFLLAYLVHRLSRRLSGRLLRIGKVASQRHELRPDRQKTLISLAASAITFLAMVTAVLLSLSLFVSGETLVWIVGLFTAAFGLGARPLVSDYLTGIGFLFEDTFDVGEKIEILGNEGVVETVNLRTTTLRARSGELFVVPNGEIRIVRNFSRGRFSPATITIKLDADDLSRALPILEELGKEAVLILPNLLEPWQIISKSGAIGQQTELTLVGKAKYAMGAEMLPRLLALVHERLNEAGIHLVD
ncbi:MAG: mechanosensitive ion channel [Ardenticatenaceae bacterium]|nr:mechanosensitive ion channel [Anaerolineales bacterium]MCB8938946.1 mechanosensitive ion channel [Ardenticatenaceae bacterium]MCB8974702.1 mechanosensitive ion channel [Ardenticatenaceae bacterium]